jgi:hypothetical protein
MMSGMYFTSNQEYKGTRNALVEQRGFAIAEYGLNSEISNWDRFRNKPSVFPIGRSIPRRCTSPTATPPG